MDPLEQRLNLLVGQLAQQQQVQNIPMPQNFPTNNKIFAEDQNEMSMSLGGAKSFLKISDANVAVIALGVMVSSAVGGIVSSFMPGIAKWAAIIAGAALMYFGKNKKMLKDFGVGVFIGGLASAFSGIGDSLGGVISGIGGGGLLNIGNEMSMPQEFAETKYTHGGSTGVSLQTPNMRTFQ